MVPFPQESPSTMRDFAPTVKRRAPERSLVSTSSSRSPVVTIGAAVVVSFSLAPPPIIMNATTASNRHPQMAENEEIIIMED